MSWMVRRPDQVAFLYYRLNFTLVRGLLVFSFCVILNVVFFMSFPETVLLGDFPALCIFLALI